jgi:hypothetical protein
MVFGYFTLFVALMISAVAEFYSIAGLTAIFSAAFWPVVIMGVCLGVGKVTAAVWLKLNWERANWTYKLYLVPAVAFLMLLTSMGIFGFLSKAHSDQSMVSGDSMAKVAIYDEKIKTEKENIDANRKALKQMDEAVDQVMGRSSDEKGAEKAVAIRRAQQKERGRLSQDIADSQKRIAGLNEERAPIAAEVRKVEAEVGPIKYIAAFIYGDNPDSNLLERAVRWVIIILVVVFDPLAIMMVLASTESMKWQREARAARPAYEPDDGPLTDQQIEQLRATAEPELPTGPVVETSSLFEQEPKDPHPPGWMYDELQPTTLNEEEVEQVIAEFDQARHLEPVVFDADYLKELDTPTVEYQVLEDVDEDLNDSDPLKAAIKQWKDENPEHTLKEERYKLARGKIDELPWMRLLADNDDLGRAPLTGFGIVFPEKAIKGDTFMRVDRMPNVLYKYNGQNWIIVDKTLTDNYTYDDAYIEHLITQLSSGEYDPDLLSDAEADAIARRVKPIQI